MAQLIRRRTTAPELPESSSPVTRLGLRRRVAPRGIDAPSLSAKLAAAPVSSMVRFTHKNNEAVKAKKVQEARAAIDEKLKSIAKIEDDLDTVMVALETAHAEVEALMRGANISEHRDGRYATAIVEKFSRQSRTIDPKKFKANVADKDFWSCVSIGVGAAEKVMTEKELNAVSEVVPGKSIGFQFTLSKIKRKVT